MIRTLRGSGDFVLRGVKYEVAYAIEEYERSIPTEARGVIHLERGLAGIVRASSGAIPAEAISVGGTLVLADGSLVEGRWIRGDGRFLCSGPIRPNPAKQLLACATCP